MSENPSSEPVYTTLFVFGDSLSDNGAVSALSDGLIPPTQLFGNDLDGNPADFESRNIFYNQRFTNGDVYADVAADLLGVPTDNTTFYDDNSGSNFAVGGSTATDLTSFGGLATTTFADQVATFRASVASLPGTEEENEAYLASSAASIFIGLNDGSELTQFAAGSGNIDEDAFSRGIAAVIDEIVNQTEELAASGIGTIILNKLPGGSFFPSTNALIEAIGPGTELFLDQLSAQINDGLENLGSALERQGTQVEIVDFFALAKEIQADQETFGFLSLENALASGTTNTTLLINDLPISQIGFLDPVHFTSELHEAFGVFQAKTLGNTQLDGEESGGALSGTTSNETIFATGGADVLRMEGGEDLAFAGAGQDVLFLGEGDDIAFGGLGDDLALGQEGDDVISGGNGQDFLIGGSGQNVLAGNVDNDVLLGGSSTDILIGGSGNDMMAGRAGDDIAIVRAREISVDMGYTNSDFFWGGQGEDTLLIVSNEVIQDVGTFLIENGIHLIDVEHTHVLTDNELATYDFGTVKPQVDIADLFGLI